MDDECVDLDDNSRTCYRQSCENLNSLDIPDLYEFSAGTLLADDDAEDVIPKQSRKRKLTPAVPIIVNKIQESMMVVIAKRGMLNSDATGGRICDLFHLPSGLTNMMTGMHNSSHSQKRARKRLI